MPEDTKLIIFRDKSILEKSDGSYEVFEEGKNSQNAKIRVNMVKDALAKGFFRELIESELDSPTIDTETDAEQAGKIKALVDAVTSEVGRALIGITIMQLCIKSICPEQNIRLHKGGTGGVGKFSWKEGISMRTLDKKYITPILREFGLLKLNADGFMMTRSLAENYPYSELYKAAMKGGKNEWLGIVEDLENGSLNPKAGLTYLISLLINRSNNFIELAGSCIAKTKRFVDTSPSSKAIFTLINGFITNSEYSARVFEIAIHSAYQALDELGYIEGFLKPISQMRSANKKHGNIGDIEILETAEVMLISEAWDAKYGKANLREELEELSEKLLHHPECNIAGFITNIAPVQSEEILRRMSEIEDLHNCSIKIYSFFDWFDKEIKALVVDDFNAFNVNWLQALVESLCQRRRDIAPIDEPCEHWIKALIILLED